MVKDCFPIIFPDFVNHSDFKSFGEITSAGFVQFIVQDNKIRPNVYGKSISLGVESKEEDNYFILKLLNRR